MVCVLAPASAAPMELALSHSASRLEEAFFLGNSRLGAMVFGDPKTEHLSLTARGRENPATSWASLGDVSIEWLDADQPLQHYRRCLRWREGVSVTSWQRGGAGITQTAFVSRADNVLVIHLQADKPGALQFRVRLGSDQVAQPTGERGELLRKSVTASSLPTELRAWVLPFESEVAAEGNAMVVRGEGEAMIVVAAGIGNETQDVATALARLTRKYDPRDEHPDFTILWKGAWEAHRSASQVRWGNEVLPLEGWRAGFAYFRYLQKS